MKHLQAVTAVYAGGRWLRPGDPLPGDLPDFDYEKAARKGHIEDAEGGEIVNPVAPTLDAPTEADTNELERLREELRQEREGRTKDRADAETSYQVADRQRAEAVQLLSENQEAGRAALQSASESWATDKANWEAETSRLTAEVEGWVSHTQDLEAQLAEAQANALPADALERIVAVKGVGDKLGATIMAALKAPADPAPAPEQA